MGDKLFGSELARGVVRSVGALGHGHDELQMDIQSEVEDGFDWINHGRGQRLPRRHDGLGRTIAWLAGDGLGA